MTSYFAPFIIFIFAFLILGLGMDFFSSTSGFIATVIMSLAIAVASYYVLQARR